MKKICLSCGNFLKSRADGTYWCNACGNEYSENDFEPEDAGTKRVGAAKGDGSEVFSSAVNGILEITWFDSQYRHSGSGFLIDRSGYAITNTHVVTYENGTVCTELQVKIAGETVGAKVVHLGDSRHGMGKGDDLALIKLERVPSGAHPLCFEDFENVRIGQKLFVIGNSLGYGTCITSGIVSDRLRNVNGKMLMMTDCAINGGNSGGPVFNDAGRVVAVVVSGIDSAEGMNFAIPSTTVKAYLDSIRGL